MKNISVKKLVVCIITAVLIVTAGILIALNKTSSKQDLSAKSENGIIAELNDNLDYLKNNNVYFKLIDGESSNEVYIYNSHGEAVAQGNQTGYVSVFKNDGNSVRFTDKVYTGKDLDILTLMKNSVKLVSDGKATIKKTSEPDQVSEESSASSSEANNKSEAKNFKYYYITVSGWDAIESLYKYVDDDYAKSMLADMQNAVGKDTTDIQLKFTYVLGKDREFSAGCQVTYNKNTYTMWYIDGYVLLNDWQLQSSWYSYDFSNADTAEAEKMLNSLMSDLEKMFDEYADEHNISASSSSTSSSSASSSSASSSSASSSSDKASN